MARKPAKRRSTVAPAVTGSSVGTQEVATPTPGAVSDQGQRCLNIGVVWGDIARVQSEVCAVGHYMGVLPQRAEQKLDWAVSGTEDERKLLLTELTKRGALRGELGEVILFPMAEGRLAAVAGMGRPGTFNHSRLEILTRALVGYVGMLPRHRSLATVLIGSGEGNRLRVRDCVETMLRTTVEAVANDPLLILSHFRIVELYLDRALEVQGHLERVLDRQWPKRRAGDLQLSADTGLQTDAGGRIDTRFGCSMMLAALAECAGSGDASKASLLDQVLSALPDDDNVKANVLSALQDARKARTETEAAERLRRLAMEFRIQQDGKAHTQDIRIPARLGFWAEQDRIRATAITNTVTVTERELLKRLGLVREAVERLQNPEPELQPQYSADLYRLLVHRDLRELVQDRTEPLVLEVDASLAPVQWEMLQAHLDAKPLGIARPVARQLRTLYSPRPAEIGTRDKLRVLVVGDPGDPKRNHSLPDAQEEAEAVWEILAGSNRIDIKKSRLLIGAPADGTLSGPLFKKRIAPADYFEVVQRLLSGDFDMVHYCGHAQFDPDHPSDAGWVFKAGVLTAADWTAWCAPPRSWWPTHVSRRGQGLPPKATRSGSEGTPSLWLRWQTSSSTVAWPTTSAPPGKCPRHRRRSSRSVSTESCSAWSRSRSARRSDSRATRCMP